MENLLETVGYQNLIGGVWSDELPDAIELLEPLATRGKTWGTEYIMAVAYKIGIMQGIHNERARRKAKQADNCEVIESYQEFLKQGINAYLGQADERKLRLIYVHVKALVE